MKKIGFIAAAGILLFTGCDSAKQSTQVNYSKLEGYFVRNDVPDGKLEMKVASQEDFDKYFGAAATMSKLPATVDFAKEYVATIILPQTNQATDILIDSLVWKEKKLTVYYTVQTGDPQGYTMRPMMSATVDRQYDSEVDFKMNGSVSKSNTVSLDIKDGQATTTVWKESGKSVVFTFNVGAPAKLSGKVSSADSLANIRFSQIILPDNTADGPFGPEISYDLKQLGTYQLIVNENMMAGDPWSGEFTIRITLTE